MPNDYMQRLAPALDRQHEAHYWLHGLEAHYHFADTFRWHLNAFLRAAKEIVSLVSIGLQNRPGFAEWFRPHRDKLLEDPLVSYLSRSRDFIVHRGTLEPKSFSHIGLSRGRRLCYGIGSQVDAFRDSDDEMLTYVRQFFSTGNDPLELLQPDESSCPCILRHWGLEPFGDTDLIDLCSTAWLRIVELLTVTVREISGQTFAPNLTCRHDMRRVQFRLYDRESLLAGKVRVLDSLEYPYAIHSSITLPATPVSRESKP